MNSRRLFPTYKKAKKFLQLQRIMHPMKTENWNIYDMKKSHPRMTKNRYFVGSYFEWLQC